MLFYEYSSFHIAILSVYSEITAVICSPLLDISYLFNFSTSYTTVLYFEILIGRHKKLFRDCSNNYTHFHTPYTHVYIQTSTDIQVFCPFTWRVYIKYFVTKLVYNIMCICFRQWSGSTTLIWRLYHNSVSLKTT